MHPSQPSHRDVPCEIHRIYQSLATAPSLVPSTEVNRLFSDLVRLARINAPREVRSVLADPIVAAITDSLQRVCASGEYELEAHWAERVGGSAGDPWEALRAFPYFDNYVSLCRLEMNALASVAPSPVRRAVFVGGGPLPVTSILMARDYGVASTSVDASREACRLAEHLAERLGLTAQLMFHEADILDVPDLGEFDVVVLASLVGLGRREKTRVLGHLAKTMRSGGLLLLRSSSRLRTLLYPAVALEQLEHFEPLLEIHPHHEVINSVIVARREP